MSDLAAAESPKTYTQLGITHVLSVMPGKVILPAVATRAGPTLKTLQIPITDTPFEELAAHLAHTTAFICDALQPQYASGRGGGGGVGGMGGGGAVLVHCVQGMSRSASVIAAYLICTRGCSVREAVDYVKSRSSTAQPNVGFMAQLQEYHEALRAQQQMR